MLAIAAAGAAIEAVAEAGNAAIRAKSERLTGLMVDLFDEWLAPLGFDLATPRRNARQVLFALVLEREVNPIAIR